MIILPTMMPINMDLLFLCFAGMFYAYGVYLHYGYENAILSAHNPIFNTSYHHYTHHAGSVLGKPVYTGFFFKIWDQLFDTQQKTPCRCVECRPASERNEEAWKKVDKPDYGVLLDMSWWVKTSLDVQE